MNITVTISDLNPRQTALAAEVLEDINTGRIQENLPVFLSLDEWARDNILQNLISMVREKDRVGGELRREAWVQATDEQRAAVDEALGIE